MKKKNIIKILPIFSLLISLTVLFAACDRGSTHGTKSGGEGEEPEAYGLQEDDLPGGGEDPEANDNQINTAAGETQKMATDNTEAGEYNEEEAMYPAEKVEENTNLEDDKPLELDDAAVSLQKKMLMATLNGQKTDLQHQIRTLRNAPGNSEDSSIIEGNAEKLALYLDKLDQEMAKVMSAEEENFEEVAESAQAAIQGAGALVASDRMRITEEN